MKNKALVPKVANWQRILINCELNLELVSEYFTITEENITQTNEILEISWNLFTL